MTFLEAAASLAGIGSIVASGGALYVVMQAKAQVVPVENRVTRLEAKEEEHGAWLVRIESKLDRALSKG